MRAGWSTAPVSRPEPVRHGPAAGRARPAAGHHRLGRGADVGIALVLEPELHRPWARRCLRESPSRAAGWPSRGCWYRGAAAPGIRCPARSRSGRAGGQFVQLPLRPADAVTPGLRRRATGRRSGPPQGVDLLLGRVRRQRWPGRCAAPTTANWRSPAYTGARCRQSSSRRCRAAPSAPSVTDGLRAWWDLTPRDRRDASGRRRCAACRMGSLINLPVRGR